MSYITNIAKIWKSRILSLTSNYVTKNVLVTIIVICTSVSKTIITVQCFRLYNTKTNIQSKIVFDAISKINVFKHIHLLLSYVNKDELLGVVETSGPMFLLQRSVSHTQSSKMIS